nr:DUF2690 domain-containing protein [Streptomyces sp. SID14478]
MTATLGAADAFSGTSAPSTPPAPHPCRGYACEGRFPQHAGCTADARTTNLTKDATYIVRLRFSPGCRAVWSEVEPLTGTARKVSIRLGPDEVLTTHPKGRKGRSVSPMLDADDPKRAVACAQVADRVACAGAIELRAQARPDPASETELP